MKSEHHSDQCCSLENRIELPSAASIFPIWRRRSFLGALLGSTLIAPRLLAEVRDAGPCGAPPPPKPAQASAAEGIAPLPLPGTPQRRTEKKNPPRPPVIAVKIKTGNAEDWSTDLNDLNNLLIWMKASLGVNFTYDEKLLSEVDLEAAEVPVLYRTGHHAFEFSGDERRRLREYMLRGGMMIFDACCGRAEFVKSARYEIAQIFPDHKLKPIGADHPIFNCYYQDAGVVHFTPWSLGQDASLTSPGPSGIEGVELSCRMAVVFSPHDLSCGWDMHTHKIDTCTYIESEDGLKIGANFMAYATATRDMSVSAAAAKGFVDADAARTDKFRVGQIQHEGDWNPDPVGLRNLLDTVGQTTALKISFATEPVRVQADTLSKYPFLYMTGHEDFVWSDSQVEAMRQYLRNGGFLFADACCGRQKFDFAFRREMAKVLKGDGSLQPLPGNHPLYQIQNKVKTVAYTEATQARFNGKAGDLPRLEGASLNGRLVVVYSPISLNVGWRLRPVPYAVAYQPKSALDLGVNTVMYAVSQ
jgi:hypothetical protein